MGLIHDTGAMIKTIQLVNQEMCGVHVFATIRLFKYFFISNNNTSIIGVGRDN